MLGVVPLMAELDVGMSLSDLLAKDHAWCASEDGVTAAARILRFQYREGGWPKDINYLKEYTPQEVVETLTQRVKQGGATIDNKSTWGHLLFLAKVYRGFPHPDILESMNRAIAYLLTAQYKNGGWPQFYPNAKDYSVHITYNDGAMVGVMTVMKKIAAGDPDFDFVDADMRERAKDSFRRGLQCILDTQIVVDGRKTAWCAQHHRRNLRPVSARSYEPASISGMESAYLVRFLMEIKDPPPELQDAIESAMRWFESATIKGRKLVDTPDPGAPDGFDRRLVEAEDGPALWARFYDIQTNAPIYIGRDGRRKVEYNDIEQERRTGYAYLGTWPQSLFEKYYPEWKALIKPGC
jgi:PelA/Pel-15E family pectate lyase